MSIKTDYKHTLYASYLASATQAISNNFTPLLFLTFRDLYGISLEKITLLVIINFIVQFLVDLIAAKFADMVGYRKLIVFSHVCSSLGLFGLGFLADLTSEPFVGLVISVGIYAIGSGLMEVLISPIVEACPTDKKSAAMSLLHSFYCWGHVFVVVVSTLFFFVFGLHNWRIMAFLWAFIPLANACYFSRVPIGKLIEEGKAFSIKKLFTIKTFWLFVFLMICSGAAEQSISQWVSAFAESCLHISKNLGDIMGPCLFAIMMGISRLFYSKCSEKINLTFFMFFSGGLCVIGYFTAVFSPIPLLSLLSCGLCGLSVGIMWPGVLSLASVKCPKGGTAMFALLALGGDLGCASGPSVVGFVADAAGNIKWGLLAAVVFPILLIFGLFVLHKIKK